MSTYFVRSGATGSNNGTSWANAYNSLYSYFTVATPADADVIWIADDHNETTNFGGVSLNTGPAGVSPQLFLCADHTVTSPTTADLKTGAKITFANGTGAEIARRTYWYGVEFRSNLNAGVVFASFNGTCDFENCKFTVVATANNNVQALAWQNHCRMINCIVDCQTQTTTTNHTILQNPGYFEWYGGTYLVAAGQNDSPFSLSGTAYIYGVDIGATNAGHFLCVYTSDQNVVFEDCKIATGQLLVDRTNAGQVEEISVHISVIRCNDGTGTFRNECASSACYETTETTVVRTGGAVDDTTAISHKINSTTSATGRYSWLYHFKGMKIGTWNTVVTGTVNVTIEGIADPTSFSTLPNNDDVWFDVFSENSTTTTLGTRTTGTKANVLATGSALTASTQAWDSLATSRANSAAVTVGTIRKVSSNSGRLFVCTTAGTTSASLPGGYATAVDGGAVTDGTAVFTAMWRFKQTVAITPKIAGMLYAQPCFAKQNATVYIDPLMTLS